MSQSTKNTTAPAEETKVEAKKKKWSDPKMYVGPTVAKLEVVNNSVYTDYPAAFLKAAESTPKLKQLFIPIKSYPAAEKQIRDQSGYIWDAYQAALALGGDE